jgi:hypothetical protein
MQTQIVLKGIAVLAAMLLLADQPATAQTDEMRFPVAHVHFGAVCRGFLYVSSSGVRYEAVQPTKDKSHSFQLSRSEIAGVQPWIVAGMAQNIAEIRTSRAIYHFWLLRNDADVQSGGVFNGGSAAPAATLIAAIQNRADSSRFAQETNRSSGATAAPVTPDAVPAGDAARQLPSTALDGIYVALDVAFQKIRRLNFSPDGWVVKDIPQESMIGFNFTAYRTDRNTNRNFVGRYQLERDKINIEWQDFRGPAFPPSREVVKRDEVSAHPVSPVGWDIFIPMCRCIGKKFSGTYIWGQPAAGQYLQFFPDGTFLDHGVTDQLIVPSPFYLHPRIQRGTYSIQSQTMIFTFADGRRGTRTFIAPKAEENETMFDWIGLGWQQLYEQNYAMRLKQGQQ